MGRVGFTSAILYTSLSLAASGLFLAITQVKDYGPVASFGGAGWVFLLSMIVLMPLITTLVKKKRKEGGE